jgi:hypothetical protein
MKSLLIRISHRSLNLREYIQKEQISIPSEQKQKTNEEQNGVNEKISTIDRLLRHLRDVWNGNLRAGP